MANAFKSVKADMGKIYQSAKKDIDKAYQYAKKTSLSLQIKAYSYGQKVVTSTQSAYSNVKDESQKLKKEKAAEGSRSTNIGTSVKKGIKMSMSMVEQAYKLGDNYVLANTKLSSINDGLRTQAELQKSVQHVSNLSKTGYQETVGLLTKLSSIDVFKSNDNALKFVELFNKQIKISGLSASESEKAMDKMAEVLSDGIVKGDELDGLLRSVPALKETLLQGLSLSEEGLKSLAETGGLTAGSVMLAFSQQEEQLNQQFSELPVTFTEAMLLMKDQFGIFVARLYEAGGPLSFITEKILLMLSYLSTDTAQLFFQNLAIAITFVLEKVWFLITLAFQLVSAIVDNWSIVEPIVWGIVAAIAAWNILTGIATIKNSALTKSIIAMGVAIKTHPFIFVATIIIGIIAVLYKFLSSNEEVVAGCMRIWHKLANLWDSIFKSKDEAAANAEAREQKVLDLIEKQKKKKEELEKEQLEGNGSFDFEAQMKASEEEARKAVADFGGEDITKSMEDSMAVMNQDQTNVGYQSNKKGINVNRVGEVDKVNSSVDVTSEDLKLMRELAELKNIQNFVTLTPTVQVSTGDIHSGQDLDSILDTITKTLETEMMSSAEGVYQYGL